jgi:hypothetical protein
MRYLLLIYGPEPSEDTPPEAIATVMGDYNKYTQEVRDRGAYIAAEALQPTPTATTVRVRDGQTLTTDGPFAETKEALGGFYLIDARDLDEAIELAAKIPGARDGSIEVRPIWETGSGTASEPASAGARA